MIEFTLNERIGDLKYRVEITSPNGHVFRVIENGKREVIYNSREEFLEDFGELESWFWRDE